MHDLDIQEHPIKRGQVATATPFQALGNNDYDTDYIFQTPLKKL